MEENQSDKTCGSYFAPAGRMAAGFLYGKVQNFYLGSDELVLVGSGSNGKDLAFAASRAWLDVNNPSFRYSAEKQNEIRWHFMKCKSNECSETLRRYEQLEPYLSGRKKWGTEPLTVACACMGRVGMESIRIDGAKEATKEVGMLGPFLLWFEERGLWIWPEFKFIKPDRVNIYSVENFETANQEL